MLENAIVLITVLIIGYFIGKQAGYKKGIAQGKADTVLLIRQKSYEQGYCTLCNRVGAFGREQGCITTDPSTYNT